MAKRTQSTWLSDTYRWMRTLPRLGEDVLYDTEGEACLVGCGCPVAAGCDCAQKTASAPRHHDATPPKQRTTYHTAVPAAPVRPAPTPVSLVRRLVAEKKAEMRREEIEARFHGTPGLRRIRNETARAHRHAVASEIPSAYDAAIEQRRHRDQLREAHR